MTRPNSATSFGFLVIVDGNGTVDVGDSHKGNLSYDPTGFSTAQTYGGRRLSPNSFRELPATQ